MKLLKLLPLLIIPTVAIPMALSLSSCSLYGDTIREININNYDGAHQESQESKVNVSLHSLLWGNKSYNDGNYILFISQSCNQTTTNFLYGHDSFTRDDDPVLENSAGIYQQLNDATSIAENKINCLTYTYYCDKASDDIVGTGNRTQPQYKKGDAIDVFSKWGTTDEQDNSDHKNDTYICDDSAAKKYREELSVISTIYNMDISTLHDFIAIQSVKGHIIGGSNIKTSIFDNSSTLDAWASANNDQAATNKW